MRLLLVKLMFSHSCRHANAQELIRVHAARCAIVACKLVGALNSQSDVVIRINNVRVRRRLVDRPRELLNESKIRQHSLSAYLLAKSKITRDQDRATSRISLIQPHK